MQSHRSDHARKAANECAIEYRASRCSFAAKEKRREVAARESFNLAGPTGLEPATSGVTGRRSNQLNYDPAAVEMFESQAGVMWPARLG